MLKPTLSLILVLSACAGDVVDDNRAAALSVANLPAPGSLTSPIEDYAVYDAGIDSSSHCGDGAMRIGAQVLSDYLATFEIGGTNYPVCGGFHAFGSALDIWISGHAAKQAFADWLTANSNEMARRLGIVQIIWNHQMWRSYTGGNGPRGGWGPYTGPNPHTDHVHISLGEAGARAETSFFVEAIRGGATGRVYAFQADDHALWTHAGRAPWGMMPGTSPAIAGAHFAFVSNAGSLWVDGTDHFLGVARGTSPSITVRGDYAFQSNVGQLWINHDPQPYGMAPGTNPDIAPLAVGGNVVAFQSDAGELWVDGRGTGLGMAPGTSPSIAGLAGGGYVYAFQSNAGQLWIGDAPMPYGMAPGTSPSIAALPDGGYRVAFQADTNMLYVDGAAKPYGMMPGTSPSVAPNGDVMFQANTGELWLLDRSNERSLFLGMDHASSPAN